jgi:hypothetical protein
MNIPKIKTARAIDNRHLIVEFDNDELRRYDITPLLDREMFAPLKDFAFFKNVQVEPGGYAVYWNSEIDISEWEVWRNGSEIEHSTCV